MKNFKNLFYVLTLGTLTLLGSQKLKAQAEDTNPPVVQVRHHPTDPNDTSDIYLNITATDGQSGIKSLKLYLNDYLADSLDFSEPYENQQTLSKLINVFWPPPNKVWGTHGYYAIAVDGSDNVARDPLLGDLEFNNTSGPTWSLTINRSTVLSRPGWSLVSLPNNATSPLVSQIFPNSISLANGFNNEGYFSTDTLELGKSYWVKFSNLLEVNVVGDSVTRNTIPVKEGWNLIGTKDNFTLSTPIENISSEPSDIINSKFYNYDKGYHVANGLNRGVGYWVNVGQDGNLIINDHPVSNLESRINNNLLPPPAPFEQNIDSKKEVYVLEKNNGFTFKSDKNFSGITIYDILGREVKKISGIDYLNKFDWDLKNNNGQNISNGVYLFRLFDGENIIHTGKLAKTK